ncbi:UNVERIFIED_CONTAM: hypothetical protein Sangu_0109500 [Sesamum angustifolium]|uniref:Uncharacterized protein n=1 Tax=Sesamum angustifolium TaxID=2727405 RepID=A0AAW2RK27_9LAMI
MVRAVEEDETQTSPLGGMCGDGGQETRNMSIEINGPLSPMNDDKVASRSHDLQLEQPRIGCALQRTENIKSPLAKDGSAANPPTRERQHTGRDKK